jgi:hypothetical protein
VPDTPYGAQWFSKEFDAEFDVGHEEGNRAFFGLDVLRGLVDGIDEFVQGRQRRWRQFRSMGPVLLGCTPWFTDPELMDRLRGLSGACVVLTKQGRSASDVRKLEPLAELNEHTPGLPIGAFPDLGGLAPKSEGEPRVVGPYDRWREDYVPTIRTMGYRRRGQDLAPIPHAKLAILGHLWWHDEGPLGHVEDVVGFTAKRLWISSANFTRMSRRHLEFGYWTEDKALVEGAERFLLQLVRFSETLDPDTDSVDPDLAPVEFDNEAMAEAWADHLEAMAEMDELDDDAP